MSKRSVAIAGHRTSVSVEEPFWEALAEIAAARRISMAAQVAEIDRQRPAGVNLSAAIRLYVLAWYRREAAAPDRLTG